MPRKKKDDLEEVVSQLMTMTEASQWIEENKAEFGLTVGINTDTLKKASQTGRLKAILKSHIFLTREQELREYIKNFDPKNKRESRPLKARALSRRRTKAAKAATTAAETIQLPATTS